MSRSGRHIRSSENSENQIHLEKNENKLDRYPSRNWRQFQSAEAEDKPETSASQIQPFRARRNYNEDRQRSSRGGSQRESSVLSSQANQRQGRTRTYGNLNTVSNESNVNRYAWLEELSEKDAPVVAKILTNERSKFENILRQSLPPKLLGIVLKVMSKFCATDFEENKVSLLSQACKHNFLDQLSQYIALIPLQGRKEEIQEIGRFLEDIVTFTETIMSHLPTRAQECFDRIFTVTSFMIEYYEGHHSANFNEEVKMRFENLKTLHAASKTEVKEKKIDGVEKGNDGRGVRRKYGRKEKRDKSSELPPNEFRVMSLFPTPHELVTNESAFIRPNIIDGAYDSVEHYLDVQFRLLREDFMAPLKEGISNYVNSVNKEDVKKIDNIRIHYNVKFVKPKVTREHLGVVVCFDPNNKCRDIKWDISKIFMFGSLLLFTRDNFTNIIFATVVERDAEELKKGNIVVKFEGSDVTNDIFNHTFLMAESEVYFEPYFHVMKALKDMGEFTFPMEKYIIRVETSQQLPQYARSDKIIQINNKKISLLDDKSWPDAQELQFDVSQYNAFKAALTKEFVIIQGPPGTGKTFLGLEIAKTLLQNSKLWHSFSEDIRHYDSEDDEEIEVFHSISSSCPMLVVSLTNHALDQFLEGLVPMTKNMVRIGGQSKSEILKAINLREKRIREAGTIQLTRVANYVLKCMMLSTKRIQCDMEAISSHRGIVSVFVLRNEGILGHHFHNFEHDGSAGAEGMFLEWLECGKYDDIHDALTYDAEEFINKAYQARDNKLYAECSELQSYLMATNIPWNLIEREIAANSDLYDSLHYGKYDQRIWNDLKSLKRLPSRFKAMLTELYDMKDRNYYPIVTLALELDELDNKIRENECHMCNLNEECQQNPNLVYKIKALEKENEGLKLRSSYIKRNLFYYDGVPDESIAEQLLQQEDLWQLQADERWIIYWYWMHMLRRNLLLKMEEWQNDLQTAYRIKDEIQDYNDLQALKNSKVVGMTTTGAARHHKLLQDLKPKIVFVEEAAEVMESHIVVSLTNSCEHVILIGDHQQLRPSPAVYKLAIKYNFDISLFERMLKNNMQCSVLKVQYRMRPEIAQLITPTIYPELENHSSVTEFESIRGVLKSVFFITHEYPEDQMTEASSHRNKHEAEFLMALGCYLIHQGYQPSQITILTTYSGQMFHLLNEQKNYEMLKDIQITTVDNFQGEENDIILLSLVRSNTEAKIGFLNVENRVCVALSRAKKGLYIIGNMKNLTRRSKIWPKIKETLQKQDGYGLYLTLRCQIHPSQFTKVNTAIDFRQVPEGCCSKICEAELECGHMCKNMCHLTDRDHKDYKCPEPCNRIPDACEEEHKCPKVCSEECGPCMTLVPRTFPCGHSVNVVCSKNKDCTMEVEVVLPLCGHAVTAQCYMDKETVPCQKPCEKLLECGHICQKLCHAKEDPLHLEYKCMNPCTKRRKNCNENHTCKNLCHEECLECKASVLRKLPKCGHEVRMKCSADVGTHPCDRDCTSTLSCGHPCPNKCSAPCGNCQVSVEKLLEDCEHYVQVKCCEIPDPSQCKSPCKRILPCGHKCTNLCSEKCVSQCRELVYSSATSLCGHPVNSSCYMQQSSRTDKQDECRNQKKLLAFCETRCYSVLECGHKCSGTYGKCFQGRVHKPCKEKCEAPLLCGHRCNANCVDGCPPCQKNCMNKCKHSQCLRMCGQQCFECKKPCDWACKHQHCRNTCFQLCDRRPCNEPCDKFLPCHHPCAGFCGETCPPLCRICQGQEDFETTAESATRFVYLEDCGHTVKAEILDELVAQAKHQIGMLVCPDCSCSIITTARYRNNAKTFFQNISHVKSIMLRNMERKTPKEISFLGFNILIDDDYDFDDDEDSFHLFKQLRYNPKMIEGSFSEQLKVFYKKLQAAEEHIEKNLLDMLLKILEQVTTSLSNVCLNLHRTSINEVVRHTRFLLHVMGRQEVYSTQVVDDFNLEIQRLHTLCKLSNFMNGELVQPHSTNPEVQKYYTEAQSIILSLERYSEQEHGKALNVIQSIKNTVVELTLRDLAEQNLEKVEKFTGDFENFVVELEKKEEALTTEWTSCREKLTKLLADEEKEPMEVDEVIIKCDVELVESINTMLQAFDLDSMPQIKKFREALENSKKIVMNLKDKEYKLSTKVKEMLNEVRNLRKVINKVTDAERMKNIKTHYLQLKEMLNKFAELTQKTSSSESITTLQTYLRGMKDLADFQLKEHFSRDEKVKPLEHILYYFKQGIWYKCPRSHIYASKRHGRDEEVGLCNVCNT
ncbi:NFX1-type zinc finger-containing protein 1-like [Periplaneta americana]|uniref:NFX1-type zinc finger-containing protein 1-like n=1 Tax=Periplaneta americana TaxID=6978 RepID=UPI0037E829E4